MMQDLVFNTANINSYANIPTSIYPTLPNVFASNVVISSDGMPLVNSGLLPNGNNVSLSWTYPGNDNFSIRVAVGYQLQIFVGTYSLTEAQSISGPNVYEVDNNMNPDYVDLSQITQGSADIPSGILLTATNYTARIRILVFSELGAGTIDGQYFKYTNWGAVNFGVDAPPAALNLGVLGEINGRLPSGSTPNLSFAFIDPDGPYYYYRVQIGTVPGVSFAANIWDSGLIFGGAALGDKDVSVRYAGSVLATGTYYWRVFVSDGMVDGGWTDANDSFVVNTQPSIDSLKIDGNETIFGTVPTVSATSPVLTWNPITPGDVQHGYSLVVTQAAVGSVPARGDILNTGFVSGQATTVNLPDLPVGATIQVSLQIMDSVEFSRTFTMQFVAGAVPSISGLEISGETNPGDVGTPTPTVSWRFGSISAGTIQYSYQIQVASDALFSSLLWDSGIVVSAASSIVYGEDPFNVPSGTPVGGTPLVHGSYYYLRVMVSDGITNSPYATAFFAINVRPPSPVITTVHVPDGININWVDVIDSDGDTVTYTIEMTNRSSAKTGWEFLAGPIIAGVGTFSWDTSNVPSGNDYGLRVLANDGFCDSDPTTSTAAGLAILPHPPTTPILLSPKAGEIETHFIGTEWVEGNPPSVDGRSVIYALALTRDASATLPLYEPIGIFSEGTIRTAINVSAYPNGTHYRLRMTARDSSGSLGGVSYSEEFTVNNVPEFTDFEVLNGNKYASATDGSVYSVSQISWGNRSIFSSLSGPIPVSDNSGVSVTCAPNETSVIRIY